MPSSLFWRKAGVAKIGGKAGLHSMHENLLATRGSIMYSAASAGRLFLMFLLMHAPSRGVVQQ